MNDISSASDAQCHKAENARGSAEGGIQADSKLIDY